MINQIKMAVIKFPGLRVKPGELHKIREYFAEQFRAFDLLHNNQPESDTYFYRYPAIQFKLTDLFSVYAYTDDAIAILKEVFLKSEHVNIAGKKMDLREMQMEIKEASFGEDGQFYRYVFMSPWLALNQKNYKKFRTFATETQKADMLRTILVSNIIAFCKFADYTVEQRLVVTPELEQVAANLKGDSHIGFKGEFKVNFLLPDYLGLGKSSSHGYGAICTLKE